MRVLIFDEYLFDRVPTVKQERTKFYKMAATCPTSDDFLGEESIREEPQFLEYPGTLSQRLAFFL